MDTGFDLAGQSGRGNLLATAQRTGNVVILIPGGQARPEQPRCARPDYNDDQPSPVGSPQAAIWRILPPIRQNLPRRRPDALSSGENSC